MRKRLWELLVLRYRERLRRWGRGSGPCGCGNIFREIRNGFCVLQIGASTTTRADLAAGPTDLV